MSKAKVTPEGLKRIKSRVKYDTICFRVDRNVCEFIGQGAVVGCLDVNLTGGFNTITLDNLSGYLPVSIFTE